MRRARRLQPCGKCVGKGPLSTKPPLLLSSSRQPLCVRAVRRPESHGVFCVKEGQRCRHNCRGLKNTTVVGTSSAFSAPSPPLPPPRPSTSTAKKDGRARGQQHACGGSLLQPQSPHNHPRSPGRSSASGAAALGRRREAAPRRRPALRRRPARPQRAPRPRRCGGSWRRRGATGGRGGPAARPSLPPVRPSLRLAAGGCRGRVGSGLPRLLSGGWRPPMRGSLNPLPVRRVFRVVKPTDRRARPDPRSSSRRRRSHSLVRSVPAPARVRVFASPHRPSPLRHYQDSFNAAFPAPVSPPMTKYRRRPGGDHRPLPPEHPGSAKGPTSSRCLLDPLSPEGRCSPGGFRAGMAAGLS